MHFKMRKVIFKTKFENMIGYIQDDCVNVCHALSLMVRVLANICGEAKISVGEGTESAI